MTPPITARVPTTWFITGASRGIGRELTEQVLARGDRVAATLRSPEQLDDLRRLHGDRLWTQRLDVTDTTRIERVVGQAFAEHDRIDVVVSNAGSGVFGTAEDLEDAQVERAIATNLTGSIQLARRVVPHLREQGGGVLVQLSSMGGHLTFPGFAIYHATKWGVEGYFDALAQEVAPFGIHTMLVEPGMVRTTFYDAAERVPLSAPYLGGPADRPPMPVEDMPGSQSGVAHAIVEAALSPAPPRGCCSTPTPTRPSPRPCATDWPPSRRSVTARTRRTPSVPSPLRPESVAALCTSGRRGRPSDHPQDARVPTFTTLSCGRRRSRSARPPGPGEPPRVLRRPDCVVAYKLSSCGY